MNRIRLVQATVCLVGSGIALWANVGLVAALLALAACGYVAIARGEGPQERPHG